MDSLRIRDALELHKIISPYLPTPVDEDVLALETIHQIINSMKENNQRAYVDAVLLMSKMSIDELQKLESLDILTLFIDGLGENQIVFLDSFCKKIGMNYG